MYEAAGRIVGIENGAERWGRLAETKHIAGSTPNMINTILAKGRMERIPEQGE
jgi:hypothetical protein